MIDRDTIFALSTAVGKSGVAIIRVSGPSAWEGCQFLLGSQKLPSPRSAVTRKLYHPQTNELLDNAMVIGFRAPASFTGEECIEYHVHGGSAIIQGILSVLSALPYHRMALPGEFTRRAFENGKMDLTAAEAVADLIHAETESQRLQALKQMDGALFHLYEGWKDRIAKLLALLEADLDFSDQDLPDDLLLKVRPDVSDIIKEIDNHVNDGRRGELLRDGFRLVILGAPNAGKSSLLNRLVQRDAAIVSPIAGTTRDVIDVHLNLGGYPVVLADTAGLRLSDDSIESEGMNRALNRASQADIKILLFDGTIKPDNKTLSLMDDKSIIVINKSDTKEFNQFHIRQHQIYISALTGEGVENLVSVLIDRIKNYMGRANTPALTRARHREALEKCYAALERSMTAPLPELVAEDLRLSVRYLGSITGRVDIEDLLDMIFRDFCIGK
jgi:tRNA modification GTPase